MKKIIDLVDNEKFKSELKAIYKKEGVEIMDSQIEELIKAVNEKVGEELSDDELDQISGGVTLSKNVKLKLKTALNFVVTSVFSVGGIIGATSAASKLSTGGTNWTQGVAGTVGAVGAGVAAYEVIDIFTSYIFNEEKENPDSKKEVKPSSRGV